MREGWETITLGDVCCRDDDHVSLKVGVMYPAVGVARDGLGLFTREPFTGGQTSYRKLTRIHEGQLVLRTITAWEAPIAVVGAEHDGFFVSGVFPTFTLDASRILPRFMRLVCQTQEFWNEMRLRSQGTVLRRMTLSPSALLKIPMLLPPLAEQRRIVDLIANVDDTILAAGMECDRAETLVALLRDRMIVARGCPSRLLGDVLRRIDSGLSPVTQGRPPKRGEPAVLKLSAIRRGRFIPSEAKALPQGLAMPERAKVRSGDVLITRSNTPQLVGDVCWVERAPPETYLSDLILRLEPIPEILDGAYLAQAMLTTAARGQIESSAHGTSASMWKISRALIRTFTIPLPTVDRQREIAALLESASNVTLRASVVSAKLRAVRTALLGALLSSDHRIPDKYDQLLVAGVA